MIGVLAARYGFSVSVDTTSPYGGVRAVVLLPDDLLTSMPEPAPQPQAKEIPTVAASSPMPPEEDSAATQAPATTFGGLPKRSRRGPISIVPEADAGAAPARSTEQIASVMGAFQRGTQSGRRSTSASSEGPETQ